MYGNYEVALNQLEYVGFRRKNHSTQSAAALLAGSLEAVLVPCERVQALLVDPRHNTRFPHVFAVLAALVRQRNALRELYVGFTPVLFRNGPSFALYLWLKVCLAIPHEPCTIKLAFSSHMIDVSVMQMYSLEMRTRLLSGIMVMFRVSALSLRGRRFKP